MISPQKPGKLPALLLVLFVCAAGILAPTGAAAWHAGAGTSAQKSGGKRTAGKHCRQRAKKSRRACRSRADRRSHRAHGAALPPASALPPQGQGKSDPAAPNEEEEEGIEGKEEGTEDGEEAGEDGEGGADGEEGAEGEEEAPEDGEEAGEDGEGEEGTAEEPAETAKEDPTASTGGTGSAAALRWAPPILVDPLTITLGTGYTHTVLSPARDYILRLPETKKIGGTWIEGGRNVVIVGGAVTVPAPSGMPETGAERRAFYIKGATGTVHIEGVEIDNPSGAQFDGVAIAAPDATVQLENLRITDLRGGYAAYHADIVQPWGGVKALRIDRLTGSSDYQGLTLAEDLGPIGSSVISNVNLAALSTPTTEKGGHMVWLTKGTKTCQSGPAHLSSVYLQPRGDRSLSTSVWPPSNSSLACSASGGSPVSWPKLPVVAGGVEAGAPPGGDYVPAGSVGLRYKTPGYLGS